MHFSVISVTATHLKGSQLPCWDYTQAAQRQCSWGAGQRPPDTLVPTIEVIPQSLDLRGDLSRLVKSHGVERMIRISFRANQVYSYWKVRSREESPEVVNR